MSITAPITRCWKMCLWILVAKHLQALDVKAKEVNDRLEALAEVEGWQEERARLEDALAWAPARELRAGLDRNRHLAEVVGPREQQQARRRPHCSSSVKSVLTCLYVLAVYQTVGVAPRSSCTRVRGQGPTPTQVVRQREQQQARCWTVFCVVLHFWQYHTSAHAHALGPVLAEDIVFTERTHWSTAELHSSKSTHMTP